jgi:hypothetical protein
LAARKPAEIICGLSFFTTGSSDFRPDGTGAKCGAACHTIAKAQDYVFTRYEKR